MSQVVSYYGSTIPTVWAYNDTTAAPNPAVPGQYDISIGGRPYMAETSFEPYRRDAYRSDSIQTIADKSDVINITGESSINNQGLWRRAMDDWSDGAGQLFLDRHQSQESRFRSSKGIDPWTQWQASLLKDTQQVYSSTTVTENLTVGAYHYIVDNGNLKFSSNLSSWTSVTGLTANAVTSIATDGDNLYIACGTHGIFITTAGASSASSWVTGTVNYVWYVGGWLLAAAANSLYLVTTSTSSTGALPTALMTTNNASFVWNCAAAGNSWVYVGGSTSNTGSNFSLIYKTQANSAGTGLIYPLIAATLPGGEAVYEIYPYSNYIMVGTSLGARFCETLGLNDPGGNQGDLKMGPIVPDLIQQVTKAVRCFVGQYRFIWFGWSNYDGVSTGLGRMDLSQFIDQQAPAYTSDLMVAGQGEILSCDWFNGAPAMAGFIAGAPIFVVSGLGLYTAATTYVDQGEIDMGELTFGLPDDKIGLFFDFYAAGAGSVGALITVDDGETYAVAQQNVADDLTQQNLPELRGELFEPVIQLFAPSGNTETPILKRAMMKALPAVVSASQHKVIINLWQWDEGLGYTFYSDPYAEYLFLDGLRQTKSPVQYVEGTEFTVTVIILAVTRLIYNKRGLPLGGFNMRLELTLQTLEN